MTQTAPPTIAAPVPVGAEVTVGPLTLRVDEAHIDDGNATVASTNSQNSEPPDGLAYILAKLSLANNGSRTCALAASDFPVTGTDGVLRRSPAIVLPDPPLNVALAPGEVTSGWVGGLVNDLANVVMFLDPAVPVGPRYAATFALTDGAALPTFDAPGEDPGDTGSALDAPAGVGDTIRTDLWEVTVTQAIGSRGYFDISDYRVRALDEPVPGEYPWQALGLDVTVRNAGEAPQFFSWTGLELVDETGEPWDHLLAMTQPRPPASVELLPGATRTGWYGIWLQPWATTSLLRFRDSGLSDDFRYISLNGTGSTTPPDSHELSGEPLDVAPGDLVEATDGPLNLRADASTAAGIVTELDKGTRLAITGDPVESGGYRWYPVEVVDSGESGVIVQEYITPADR